jgi:diaminohydroxyphosphoribosylaminopyrimidine deaminase/5-amino-6-(5-phosphoribosylamino)uracil reductase
MAGVNTVLADDPYLTARSCGGRGGTAKKQPLRVIVDGKVRTPPRAQLFKQPGETLLALGRLATADEKEVFRRVGAELVELPSAGERVDLEKLFRALSARGVTSVLVEGGGILIGSLFDSGLVDKVVAFIAPVIIGGEEAKTAVGGRGVSKAVDSFRLEGVRVERSGGDIMVSGYVAVKGRGECSPAL